MTSKKIGFGGGCHWCTEAYFQALKGVQKVEQGWISATFPNEDFSEAVIVHYNPNQISLATLIAIHLRTHAATKKHNFRKKYRSSVYVFDDTITETQQLIESNQPYFEQQIITQALAFQDFKLNSEKQLNYYKKNNQGVFCQRYIEPKLELIENQFATYFKKI